MTKLGRMAAEVDLRASATQAREALAPTGRRLAEGASTVLHGLGRRLIRYSEGLAKTKKIP